MKTNRELTHEFAEALFSDHNQKNIDIMAFSEHMLNSSSNLYGKRISASPIPKIFNEQSRKLFEKAGQEISSILGKVIEEYRQNPEYRKIFNLDPRLVDLICIEPGYECTVPFGRFDVFFNEDQNRVKFCEFNSDGSSGMDNNRNTNDACYDMQTMQDFASRYSLEGCVESICDGWAKSFLEIYETFECKKSDPTIAIVDYFEHANLNDFELYRCIFEGLGYHAIICDVREFEYDGRVLRTKGTSVDAILRRCVSTDVLNFWQESQALISATRDKNVAMIGGFFGALIHDKQTFAYLRMPETFDFLEPIERIFLEDFLPVTEVLTSDFAEEHKVFADPSKWVIKASDLYAGKGIFIGKDFLSRPKDWEKAVQGVLKSDDIYICQEFIEPYESLSLPLEYKASDLQKEPSLYKNITGIYMSNGQFGGLYSRLGSAYNIGNYTGGYCTASFFVK
ncbi:MAG: hypothetical protein HUJ51_00350 [Eggerthellaceae bacterium]|nr:hypothetical protein [Eggerthellaceae bacterium]